MIKQNQVALVVVAGILGMAIASIAMAAPKDFCRTYAKVAVNQSNQAQAQNLGCTGFRLSLIHI